MDILIDTNALLRMIDVANPLPANAHSVMAQGKFVTQHCKPLGNDYQTFYREINAERFGANHY